MIASPLSRVWISISILDKSCLALLNDDVAVAPVAKTHDNKRVDLGEHFLVDVLGLPDDDVSEKTDMQ